MPFSHYRKGRKGNDQTPPDVFICTPNTSGKLCASYVMSMTDSADYFGRNDVAFDYWLHTEDCHVDDARNFLVKQFMDSGAEYMIFIDDDVGWETEALAKLLCYKDADIVGGAYPLRQQKEDYPVRIMAPKDMPLLQARPDGLLEVEGVPTGFMRIHRKVIDALSKKRKHLWFSPKESRPGDKNDKLQIIFERMMVDGRRWSGDLNFCREAKLLGFRVWVDPEITFTHTGLQRWEGHLGNFLRKKSGILDPRLDQAMEQLIAGDNSLENFQHIWKYYGNEYAMGPTGMKEVYDKCAAAKGPILEVGSGLTTIIAGIACIRNGQTVHSLEHDIEWFRVVRNYIQLWKTRAVALHYAPLAEYPDPDPTAQHPMMWYGDGVLDDLPEKFDVAIIDGPPRRYGREAAYKLIGERIKDATWIVDDTDDASQLAMVTKHAANYNKTVTDYGSSEQGRRHHAIVA
jgi:hypothetical protein